MSEKAFWKGAGYRLLTAVIYLLLLAALFFPYSGYLIRSLATRSLSASEVFLYDHDWIQQGIPYYREFIRCVETGTLHWSWNEFLGTPFYASKATYVIGDPFAWITYGLYKSLFHYLPTALFIVTGLKLFIAGLGFERLLEHFSRSRAAALVFGACYMMGGWALIFMEQIYFLSFYALIPFVLLGIEAIRKGRGHYLFYAAVLLTLTTNLYLTWSLCFFLVLYWFVRADESGWKGKVLWTKTAQVLFTFVCAFLTAMVVILPGILVLLKSPRLSGHLIDYAFWSKHNVLAIVMNFFVPVIDGENLLYHDYWYYFYQIGIYCGSFALLCVPQLFVQKRPRAEKIRYGVMLLVALLTLAGPKVGILLNLSYSLRYTYMIEIVLLLLAAKALEQPFHKVTVLITGAVLILICLSLTFGFSGLSPQELQAYPEAVLLWISIGLITMMTIFLAVEDKWKTVRYAVLATALAETVSYGNVAIRTKTTQREPAEYLYRSEEVEQVLAAIREDDPGFFRVNLLESVQADISVLPNSGMYYGIPSLSGYDSVYENALHDFLAWQGLYPDVSWNFRINDDRLDAILNAKYTIVTPATAPLVSKNSRLLMRYSTDTTLVYQNTRAEGAARTVSAFLPQSQMDRWMEDIEGNRSAMVSALSKYTILSDRDYNDFSGNYTNVKSQAFEGFRDGNHLTFRITLEQETPVQFSIPADSGWQMSVDEQRVKWKTCDGGFILAVLPEGVHTVEFRYRTPGFGIGLVLSVAGLALAIIWLSGKGGIILPADSGETKSE